MPWLPPARLAIGSGKAVALVCLAGCATVAGDAGGAVRLAGQAEQVQDEIPPSMARMCSSNWG